VPDGAHEIDFLGKELRSRLLVQALAADKALYSDRCAAPGSSVHDSWRAFAKHGPKIQIDVSDLPNAAHVQHCVRSVRCGHHSSHVHTGERVVDSSRLSTNTKNEHIKKASTREQPKERDWERERERERASRIASNAPVCCVVNNCSWSSFVSMSRRWRWRRRIWQNKSVRVCHSGAWIVWREAHKERPTRKSRENERTTQTMIAAKATVQSTEAAMTLDRFVPDAELEASTEFAMQLPKTSV
jgi:hypothetical protein